MGGVQRVSEQRLTCCGRDFVAAGTIHGQPASLWALLEHQANDHPKGTTVPLTFQDIRLNQTVTLTGRVITMDASNGRDPEDPEFAILSTGESLITLHIALADQPDPAKPTGVPLTHEELYSELIGAADSLDTHVDAASAASVLRALADRLEADGLVDAEGVAA